MTCYEDCLHGKCSDGPDYKCVCDLGWTGSDCSIDCGCHGHSNCQSQGPGHCDECQDNTSGQFCQNCQIGSFGNATVQGCQKCYCNLHENPARGICDQKSGRCQCKDHTVGKNCQNCQKGFFGDPRHGGHCYHQCKAKTIIGECLKTIYFFET